MHILLAKHHYCSHYCITIASPINQTHYIILLQIVFIASTNEVMHYTKNPVHNQRGYTQYSRKFFKTTQQYYLLLGLVVCVV